MKNQNIQTPNNNDEIDLKEVFRTILRYKYSIIFTTLIFLIFSSIFAYYKPNVYSSSSSIEILDEGRKNLNSTDFMLQAFGGGNVNIDNNIAVLQSRFIVQSALETLNLTTNYYTSNVLHKTTELYKDSPFIVNTKILENEAYAKTFELIPINDNSFRLVIKPVSEYSLKGIVAKLNIVPLKEVDKITYSKIHKYGEEISTAWFTFTINKITNLDNQKYKFSFTPVEFLYETCIQNLSVSQTSEFASVITLSYEDTVSLRAKEILNAISSTYIEKGVEEKTKGAELTLGFIDSQLDTINTKLTKSEVSLENYKVSHNVVDLGGKVTMATAKVAEYEAQQLELQTEINILTNLKHFMDKNDDLGGLTLGTINFADKNLGQMVTELQTLSSKKGELLVDYTELHPDVQKLTKNISALKRSIKQALEGSLRQLDQRDKDLSAMIKKYRQSLDSLPSQEKELAQLSRPLKVNQEVYQYLLQKKAETAILRSSTISGVRILDMARDEYIPIKPKRALIVIIGLILGFIVGISLAFFREFLISTIQNAEEIENITSLPIYGVIPLDNDKMTNKIFLEAFRNIRTNLQFLPGNKTNKIISITSSVSGEGKTTITATLAEMLARGDKSVIMLDLDLRKASLHKEFDVTNNIGMSNFLTMQNTLEEVTKDTNIYGLKIITTGPLPPNPSELILSSMFTNLLEVLKAKYDYVVIDTPPAGLVTDAIIIMNYSDISFAVVRANYTRKEFVKNIDRMSKEHSDNRMGIILNATKIGSEYGYGYGASYAYGYGNSQYYKDRG